MTTAPAHRSWSQIHTYQSCPKSYQLTRILRAPETPAWYLAGGSALHDVIEHISIRMWHGENPSGANLLEEWNLALDQQIERLETETGVPQAEWRRGGRATKDKPNKEDGVWWRSDGYRQLGGYIDWLTQAYADGVRIFDDKAGPWVERGVNISIGNVPVKMFLDLVVVLPGGELMVIDHKSGSRTPLPGQLRLYAYGMDAADQPRPSLGAYFMTRTGELSAPWSLPADYDPVLDDLFINVDGAIRAQVFPPHLGTHCGSCGVAQFCAAYGGAKADEYDPILTDRKA